MHISEKGIALIKHFEGCRLTAYKDGGGVLTIGYGHTGPDVKPGQKLSQADAEALLYRDLSRFEEGVLRLCKGLRLAQREFDALVSFAFNVGLDEDADTRAEGLGDSTLLRKLRAGNRAGAAAQFLLWDKDNGKVVPGLTKRRHAEYCLFMGLQYSLS